MKINKIIKVLLILLLLGMCACTKKDDRIPIRILILPKFEVGELSGDDPGEAQYFYENLFMDADVYEIDGAHRGSKLYVNKDGLALYVTGMGKVNVALSTQAILQDKRFDFSDAYFLSVGCAGGAAYRCVIGDVVLGSAVVDYDLGHSTDHRELSEDGMTWFVQPDYAADAFYYLNDKLIDQAYELVRDYQPGSTEKTKKMMIESFPLEEWANRDPQIMKGVCVTSDSYWKGRYHHELAIYKCKVYAIEDPYLVTEMEDVAIANALDRCDLIDRFLIIRSIVDLDVFMKEVTPELLWNGSDSLTSEDSLEAGDIFPVAMKSTYEVSKIIIDALLNKQLTGE